VSAPTTLTGLSPRPLCHGPADDGAGLSPIRNFRVKAGTGTAKTRPFLRDFAPSGSCCASTFIIRPPRIKPYDLNEMNAMTMSMIAPINHLYRAKLGAAAEGKVCFAVVMVSGGAVVGVVTVVVLVRCAPLPFEDVAPDPRLRLREPAAV